MVRPRTYLVFGDIEGKIGILRVECTKCDRKGRYHVHKLIKKYGRNGNMTVWRDLLSSDCPRRDAPSPGRCDLICSRPAVQLKLTTAVSAAPRQFGSDIRRAPFPVPPHGSRP